MFTRKIISILALILLLTANACSVAFAASGSNPPDFDKIKTGSQRHVVEAELGAPRETKKKGSGEAALYTYKIGDEAAPGRAMLYLIGDIFTLCLAEYIFTPLEVSNSGDAHDIVVDYNSNDELVRTRKLKGSEFDKEW